ncbi:phytoene desaturase family protein [Bailinhaonella thermotolerans]|uniref:NAD(P)/FAD-dependent oxidoreductase n=1 Tax=Bailinhaonella thermotolerans TaxID=1070861 RepID=A0A3A4BH62_9ACTN|nr:NAD(P)/FAD-dependent oxidoreductase [Bailinhaonella thermotolerans]RJL34112.1 NAD(P)/FAD-dependent oxidoreductase [Bailinhaonella thermotolerans]
MSREREVLDLSPFPREIRMIEFDGLVVGGGHNGLTCAAYLAKAGLKVAVVERNAVAGGGCSTEELTLPGFRHNTHSNYHFLEEGPVPADLELARHGLRYVYPEVQHATLFRDGTAITVHRDAERTADSIARFSPADARTWLEMYAEYGERARDLMTSFLYSPPLTPAELAPRLRGELGRDLLSYAPLTIHEAVERAFGHERVQVMFKAFLHIMSLENVPGTGGFLPRLLSRAARLGLPVGGAVSVARALESVIAENGGTVITGRAVERVLVDDGRATGVLLDNGERIAARRFVASAVDAPQTVRLAGPENFGADLAAKVEAYAWARHSLVTLHLALGEPPRYSAAEYDPDVDRAFLVVLGADDSGEMERGFDAIHRGELPERLAGNGATPTLFDPSYAPPGKHVSFWWPWAPYDLGGDPANWDAMGEEIGRRMLAEWAEFAPNLRQDGTVLGSRLFSPLDIERHCVNMVRGSHHVGAYEPSQLGANRPVPELGRYATPVTGLFLCGASSHPGGSVSAAPGYNAAGVIAEAVGVEPWWTPVPAPSWDAAL